MQKTAQTGFQPGCEAFSVRTATALLFSFLSAFPFLFFLLQGVRSPILFSTIPLHSAHYRYFLCRSTLFSTPLNTSHCAPLGSYTFFDYLPFICTVLLLLLLLQYSISLVNYPALHSQSLIPNPETSPYK